MIFYDFPGFSNLFPTFLVGDVDFHQAMHPLTASRWDAPARSAEDLAWAPGDARWAGDDMAEEGLQLV